MIRITGISGQTHYLAASAIARVSEAAASSQWHGIRAYVTTFDGRTIEAQEDAAHIATLISKESA